MLDLALSFLADRLDEFVLARTGADFGGVYLGRFVDDAGKWAVPDDRIGLTLINVEEDTTFKSHRPTTALVGSRQVVLEPDLKVSLTVLVGAHFQQYDVALRYLSWVLTFFQAHRTFTPEEHPGLDASIERLNVELLPLSFEQLNQIWTFLGGRHVPSIAYRIRLLVLQDVEPTAIQPPITQIDAEVSSR